jgi:hypothetical protein
MFKWLVLTLALVVAGCASGEPLATAQGPWQPENVWPGWNTWQPTQAELQSLPR